MSDLIVANNQAEQSPFDSIKRYDQEGNECWYARELMKFMGYAKWQRFEKCLNEAMENLGLNGDNVSDHFTDSGNLVKRVQGGGNKRQNYKLSRYACYMTALCCDGRKIQVAEAKKYFALKTRQAEVLIPQQNERIRELELMAEISRNERYLLDKRSRIMDVHGLPTLAQLEGREVVEVEKPVIEVIDNISGQKAKVMNANDLKRYVHKLTGQKIKSKKQLVEAIKQQGRDDLLLAVRRQTVTEDVDADKINEAIALIFGNDRQLLIGE